MLNFFLRVLQHLCYPWPKASLKTWGTIIHLPHDFRGLVCWGGPRNDSGTHKPATCECRLLLYFGGNFLPSKQPGPFRGIKIGPAPSKGVPTGRINGSHFTFQTDFRNVFIFGVARSCGTQQELTLFRNKTTVFRQTDKKHDVLNSVRHTTNCGKLSHCCSQHYSHPPEPESPCHPPILIFDQIGATGFFWGKLYWVRPKHHPKLRKTGTKALERIRLQ